MHLLGTIPHPIGVIALADYTWSYPVDMEELLVDGGWIVFIFSAVLGLTPLLLWGSLHPVTRARHRDRACGRRLGVLAVHCADLPHLLAGLLRMPIGLREGA